MIGKHKTNLLPVRRMTIKPRTPVYGRPSLYLTPFLHPGEGKVRNPETISSG